MSYVDPNTGIEVKDGGPSVDPNTGIATKSAVPQITAPPPIPQATNPNLDLSPQFVPPPEGVKNSPQTWNYQNATIGPHGEALPENAQGWKPDGTPYFGEGLSAKWNEYKWRFSDRTTNAPSEQDWQKYLNDFEGTFGEAKLLMPGSAEWIDTAKEMGSTALEGLDLLGKQLGSASENAGALTPVTQGLRVGLEGVFDLLQQGAYGVERGAGAYKSVWNEMAEIRADNGSIFIDLSHEVETHRESDLKRIGTALEEGWQSGRILYSSVFDKAREQEFVRRYRAGEDPALLAME